MMPADIFKDYCESIKKDIENGKKIPANIFKDYCESIENEKMSKDPDYGNGKNS